MFTRTLFSSFCIRIHLPKRFHDATAHKIRFDKLYVRPCVRCFWDAARIDSIHRDKNTYVCTLNIERNSIIPINLRWKPLYDGDPPYAAARWTRDRTLKRLHVLAHFPFLSTFLLYYDLAFVTLHATSAENKRYVFRLTRRLSDLKKNPARPWKHQLKTHSRVRPISNFYLILISPPPFRRVSFFFRSALCNINITNTLRTRSFMENVV